jgi:endonuclease YncB( thermonuclease family)
VSKHWNPGKKTVELAAPVRPSRIRRAPVAINSNIAVAPRRRANSRERDLYLGIAGVLIFAAAIAAGIVAFSTFTVSHDDPAADARALEFSQCYNAQGPNCVLDGGTIYVSGERIDIAGLDAPSIADARCEREHDRGVEAATELALLLNSGPVTIGPRVRDRDGRIVRKVEVKGRDVALTMIAQDVAHEAGSGLSWC